LKEEKFDGVFLFFLLHHLCSQEEIRDVLMESKRLIKPDGCIFIAEDIFDNENDLKLLERKVSQWNFGLINSKQQHHKDSEWKYIFETNGLFCESEKLFNSPSSSGDIKHKFYKLTKHEHKI